jgi:hypothetical protein
MSVFIGIDWSEAHHDVCILQANGSQLAAFRVPHTADGFATLAQQIDKLGLPPEENLVAVETAHQGRFFVRADSGVVRAEISQAIDIGNKKVRRSKRPSHFCGCLCRPAFYRAK